MLTRYSQTNIGGNHQIREFVVSPKSILNYANFCVDYGVHFKFFRKNIEKWEKQGLFIQNIPAYSPELNKIEILWRKIKYEWLDFSAYESFSALKNALYDILANVGQDYYINFT
ncbi:MAG: hypothetical protein D3910_06585 [Candidatus Electrothrix sp. ATG2]|nr:hypothetical protein [Candidatus Electrothrix sp. ATG2]